MSLTAYNVHNTLHTYIRYILNIKISFFYPSPSIYKYLLLQHCKGKKSKIVVLVLLLNTHNSFSSLISSDLPTLLYCFTQQCWDSWRFSFSILNSSIEHWVIYYWKSYEEKDDCKERISWSKKRKRSPFHLQNTKVGVNTKGVLRKCMHVFSHF